MSAEHLVLPNPAFEPAHRKRRVMVDPIGGIEPLRKAIHKLFDLLDDLQFQVTFMGQQPVAGAMMDAKGRLVDPMRGQIPLEPVFLLVAYGMEKANHPFWIKAREEEAKVLAAAAAAQERLADGSKP